MTKLLGRLDIVRITYSGPEHKRLVHS